MKSYTITALGIAFKIWFFAVLFNSIADTLLFEGFHVESMGVFLLIAFFAALFSAPVFLLLWSVIYNGLHAGRPAAYILKIILFTGIGLGMAAWFVFARMFNFFETETVALSIATPLSAALAIYISYPNIKKACQARDDNNKLIESLGTEQTVT